MHRSTRHTRPTTHTIARAAAVTALAIATPAALLAPAQADSVPSITCDGVANGSTINGDVVVPWGRHCFLDKVTIDGNVVIYPTANLLLMSSTVHGSVSTPTQYMQGGAYFNVWNSQVDGDVSLHWPWGAWVAKTSVGGRFMSVNPCHEGFCVQNSLIYMGENTRLGSLLLEGSDVTIENTTVDASASFPSSVPILTNVTAGSVNWATQYLDGAGNKPVYAVLCGTTVRHDAAFDTSGWPGPVVLGDGTADCPGNRLNTLSINSSWSMPNIPASSMFNTTVTGLASANPTNPGHFTLKGTGNRFLGGVAGDFVAFAAQPGNTTQAQVAASHSSTTAGKARTQSTATVAAARKRSAEIKDALSQRGQDAKAKAKRAGRIKTHA